MDMTYQMPGRYDTLIFNTVQKGLIAADISYPLRTSEVPSPPLFRISNEGKTAQPSRMKPFMPLFGVEDASKKLNKMSTIKIFSAALQKHHGI